MRGAPTLACPAFFLMFKNEWSKVKIPHPALRFFSPYKLYIPVTSRVLLFDLQEDKGVGLGNNKAAKLYTFGSATTHIVFIANDSQLIPANS